MLVYPSPSSQSTKEQDSALAASLKCAYEMMLQRVISYPNDKMGILLYGMENSNVELSAGGSKYDGCYSLIDLDIPSARDVKKLKDLIEDQDKFNELLIPCEEMASVSEVLWCASELFTTRAANFTSKRLFVVTDKDDPHSLDQAKKSLAIIRAHDLYLLGVAIELVDVSSPGEEFDRTKFYDVSSSSNSYNYLSIAKNTGSHLQYRPY